MSSSATFPAGDFDQWADTYDRDVIAQGRFPFAGYEEVLSTVVRLAETRPGMSVLDIGTGTGNLAKRFTEAGCKLWATDFSSSMLERARAKLPDAKLVLHDLDAPWPPPLDRRFDRIVSAYVFHHFELKRKIELTQELALRRLVPGGRMILADISFPDAAALRRFAAEAGDAWEEEYYWLADESIKALEAAALPATYEQVSDCAGVYCIEDRAGTSQPS
jgi:putative AdoMet-dependent methyltransferase